MRKATRKRGKPKMSAAHRKAISLGLRKSSKVKAAAKKRGKKMQGKKRRRRTKR